jgi:hypothetical protein
MRLRLLVAAVPFLLAAPLAATAQPATAAHAEAEDLFRRGREALARGDYQGALALLRDSQALERGRGKLVNIAICEEKLGQLATAAEHFQEVLPQLPADDDRLPIVKQRLAELEPRLPRLRVVLAPGAPAGALVRRDGAPLAPAALGAEIPIDPGKHVVTVSAPGVPEKRYEITAFEGKRETLTVEPGTSPALAPAPAEAAPPASGLRVGGFVAGGVGLAGFALFGVAGAIALSDHGFVEGQCPSHMGCSPEVLSRASAGKALSIASAVGLGLGIAGIGVAIPLLVKGRAPAPKVGVTALPGGAFFGAQGAF